MAEAGAWGGLRWGACTEEVVKDHSTAEGEGEEVVAGTSAVEEDTAWEVAVGVLAPLVVSTLRAIISELLLSSSEPPPFSSRS